MTSTEPGSPPSKTPSQTPSKAPSNPTLVNLPNGLTLLRLALVPVFVVLLVNGGTESRVAAFIVFGVASITDLLDGDTTFVNRRLARHYGLPSGGTADEWVPVEGLRARGRGGVLGMAVFLTKNSQPQRTSPVKRGFWVVHKLLGEQIPPPPPDVAVLPAGTGHFRLEASRDFLVVGAYPPDQTEVDLCRDGATAAMLARIAELPFPNTEPLAGAGGPLPALWRTAARGRT